MTTCRAKTGAVEKHPCGCMTNWMNEPLLLCRLHKKEAQMKRDMHLTEKIRQHKERVH